MCFCTEYDVLFLNIKKNYLSQNIVIGLILKTDYRTMFSLNAIGLEKKFLNEIVQSEKKLFFHFNFLIFQFIRERIKLSKRFGHHSICFQNMHIVSEFQFFIHISIVVKLKNKIPNFKRGKKGKKEPVFVASACIRAWITWNWPILITNAVKGNLQFHCRELSLYTSNVLASEHTRITKPSCIAAEKPMKFIEFDQWWLGQPNFDLSKNVKIWSKFKVR